MFTYHDVKIATALIKLPKDGSQANAQARDKAAQLLINAASVFRQLAGENITDAANYLRHMALEFEIIAQRK